MLFRDRKDAGTQLGERLKCLVGDRVPIVLGIPRGGLVVAAQVARSLDAPLDVFVAHKVGAPFNPELAIGAVTSTGDVILDDELIGWLKLKRTAIERQVQEQRADVARRFALYRGNRAALAVEGKVVIVIDDGIATGATMFASLTALRRQAPAELVLAVPVACPDALTRLEAVCDQVVVLSAPQPFFAVGRFYRSFEQTTDEEVIALLKGETASAA